MQLLTIKEKRVIFLGPEKQKMINSENVIVQRVVFLFFFQLNFNKIYPVRVTKIAEVMYGIYQRLSKRRLYKKKKRRRKVKNAPEVNLYQNFAFASTLTFSPREIT